MYRSMVQPVRVSRECGMASSTMAPSASGGTTLMAYGPCFSDRTGTKAALGGNNGWWRGPSRVRGSGPALRGQSHHGPRHGKKRGSRTTHTTQRSYSTGVSPPGASTAARVAPSLSKAWLCAQQGRNDLRQCLRMRHSTRELKRHGHQGPKQGNLLGCGDSQGAVGKLDCVQMG
jgi:hypothetical protein